MQRDRTRSARTAAQTYGTQIQAEPSTTTQTKLRHPQLEPLASARTVHQREGQLIELDGSNAHRTQLSRLEATHLRTDPLDCLGRLSRHMLCDVRRQIGDKARTRTERTLHTTQRAYGEVGDSIAGKQHKHAAEKRGKHNAASKRKQHGRQRTANASLPAAARIALERSVVRTLVRFCIDSDRA